MLPACPLLLLLLLHYYCTKSLVVK
eukprot:COSAG02_NODE_25105_length_669_cov_0.782456_2_plen_24_part_01